MVLRLLKPDSTGAAFSQVAKCTRIPILLVDEDPVFRQALAENLRIDGHQVVECATGAGALPAIQIAPCLALIAEYTMAGGVNGMHLADQFKASRAGPTLLLTTQEGGFVAAHVEVRPYVELLLKPVIYDRLHDVLHDLVEPASDS